MLDLYLIRHGTTESNSNGHLQGQTDVLLSPTGESEAAATAARLATLGTVDAIYASPLKRASATAAPLGEAFGMEVQHDPRWMEMDVGDLQGLTWAEALKKYPDSTALWYTAPRQVHFPGARESIDQFVLRVESAIQDVLARHSSGRVLVVSHGGTLNVCLASLLRIQVMTDMFPFHIYNCGITRIQRRDGRLRVHAVNDTSHLPSHSSVFQVP